MDDLEFKNLTTVVIVAVADGEANDVVIQFFKQQKIGRLTIQFWQLLLG